MPDGVLLATQVYLPDGDTWPWPVALMRTPYGRLNPSRAQLLTDDGYAHVAQDTRGRGQSGGEWDYANDTLDGHTTVQWITDQWWCDGNISMGGMSAPGQTTYAMAPGAPAAIKALRPEAATPDFFHHTVYQGGAFRWDLAGEWLISMGLGDRLEEIYEHRFLDEYWEPYQWIDRADQVHTPMLHIGGWYDILLQGALDGFRTFQHQGGDGARGRQYLIMGPWEHRAWGESVAGALSYPRKGGSWRFSWV